MPDNNSESSADFRAMISEMIFGRTAAIPERQTRAHPEANGELPTPEQVPHRTMDLNHHESHSMRDFVAFMSVLNGGRVVQATDEEGSGIQFSPCQIEDFLQTLDRVEISTLGTDDLTCSICKLEYGKGRGNTTEPVSGSGQALPGEESPEYPVKLSCGHVFGNWCIKTWLLGRPASCPACRFQFQMVR